MDVVQHGLRSIKSSPWHVTLRAYLCLLALGCLGTLKWHQCHATASFATMVSAQLR